MISTGVVSLISSKCRDKCRWLFTIVKALHSTWLIVVSMYFSMAGKITQTDRFIFAFRGRFHLSLPGLIVVVILSVFSAGNLYGQRRIIREVMGSGGQPVRSDQHTAHGTISQTVIGRLSRPTEEQHNVGFWYWAKQFESSVCVRVGEAAAEPGTRLTIPVKLEQADGLLRQGPLQYRVRIRFNGTLLEPTGLTPSCRWDEDACVLEFTGTVTREDQILAELEFIAKLGNDISTPLVIEEFEWVNLGEREIHTVLKHGQFTLLGVCRVDGQVRLILSHGISARVSVVPNPASEQANIEYVSDELGHIRLTLVDGIGVERMLLADQEVEGARMYQLQVDLTLMPSGSYFLVFQTPNLVRTVPLIIQQ